MSEHLPGAPLRDGTTAPMSKTSGASRGLRRRRTADRTDGELEIEELDSEVMRQNAYNYFQRHGERGTSRKRQRTLAEQLESLCLRSEAAQAADLTRRRRASAPTRQQPWPTGDVEMDSDSSSLEPTAAAAPDIEEEEDDATPSSARVKVFGGGTGAPDVKGMFFSTSNGRQRPMERMFAHYVTMATERSSRSEPTATRGDELVVFRPRAMQFPYSLFTPEQIEDMRARHNRRKSRRAAQQDRSRGYPTSSSSSNSSSHMGVSSSSMDQSWRFQELDSDEEGDDDGMVEGDADVSSSAAEDSDMDMSMDDDEGTEPRLAGSLTHGEWFLSDDDDPLL